MSKSAPDSPSRLCDSFLEFLCSHSEDNIPTHEAYEVGDDSLSYDLLGMRFDVRFLSGCRYEVTVSRGEDEDSYAGDVPFSGGSLDLISLYRSICHGAKPFFENNCKRLS